MEDVRRIHASSGTTGQPTVVAYTENDIEMWASLVARSLRASGVQPGWKIHNAYGYGLFTGGLGAHYRSEERRVGKQWRPPRATRPRRKKRGRKCSMVLQ